MAQQSDPAPSLRVQTRFSAVPDWVTFHPDLSAYAVRLYSGLMRYADKETGVAFPRRETLAVKLHMSERTVDAAVKELQAAGALVSRQRWTDEAGGIFYERGPGRRQTSTEYTVLVVPALAPQVMRGSPHALAPQEMQANDSHLTTNDKKQTTRARARETAPPAPDLFAEFWTAYPKKTGKDAARRAYAKALQRDTHDAVMAGLRRYRFSTDPQYVPHPSTWLNGGRWTDEPPPPPPARPWEELNAQPNWEITA